MGLLEHPTPRRIGGAERSRTADLLIANEALYQLSYGPRRRGISVFSGPLSSQGIFEPLPEQQRAL